MQLINCPGLYCGKINSFNISADILSCGACPRGFRSDELKICSQCHDAPKLYDWMYLGFMALIPYILHASFIEFSVARKCTPKILAAQHISAVVECGVAFLLSLLSVEPLGLPWFHSCKVQDIRDFYPMMYNPSVNYTTTLYCSYEAVYPLYSLPFIYFCLCLLCLAIFRFLFLMPFNCRKTGASAAVYAAIYFLPGVTLIHAVFAGLIYYSYPYIMLLAALISNAVYLAYYENQTVRGLIVETFGRFRNVMVLLLHWGLFAYGILAVTRLEDPILDGCLLLLVVTPSVLYVVTVSLSDPRKITQRHP